MGREVVHFTYDTNFVVVTAIQILCEKDLYDHKDSTICISNKLYDRDDVKRRYGNEITKKDSLLQTKALTYMEKIMPEGGTIDAPQLTAAKDMFLSDLVNDLMTVEYFKKADAQDQYVKCKALKKRVYCNFGEHLSAIYTLIADKPKWCRLMMNGKKKIEVRKGTALYKATQKLIDEYGYAQFYVCCSRAKHIKDYLQIENGKYVCNIPKDYESELNGKVIFKFRCYKVGLTHEYDGNLLKDSCLTIDEFCDYLGDKIYVYAIHISYLEIFDKPRELSEFYKVGAKEEYEYIVSIDETQAKPYIDEFYKLTKAPQSFCYVEIGEWKE